MRKFVSGLFFLLPIILFGQNIGIGTNSPHSSAVVDISSSNKGILIPQINLTNINLPTPLTSPAISLLVYNTNAFVTGGAGVGYYSWNGSQWKKIILDGEGNVPAGSIIYKQNTNAIPGYTLKGRIAIDNFQEYLGTGTGTWTTTSAITGSNATSGHSAVWTGTEMLIWSGQDNTYASYENTGAKYTPGTNSWAAISVASAPVGRYGHSTVWDDAAKRMLVWGGATAGSAGGDPIAFTNTGGIYNSLSNTWTAITTTSAPVARYNHSAVWTGTRMIVWGGHDGSTYYNNGSSYNPATNTWTAIAASPLSIRGSHACVWTGTKMVIWGGENGTSALNDGAMYDPATNTWSAISSTNAPASGIYDAGVAWTGTEMILVAGQLTSGTTNRIYQFDPIANTWDASFISLPGNGIAWNASIYKHSVCWTGTELLIYGGINIYTESTSMCYKFNPTDNSISYAASSPNPRIFQSAVWSGSRMLVFGGKSNAVGGYLNTGYQFDPASGSAPVFLFALSGNFYMFIKD